MAASPNEGLALETQPPSPLDAGAPGAESENAANPIEQSTIPRIVRKSPSESATPWYRGGLVSLAVVLTVIGGVACLARRYLTPTQVGGGDVLRVLCRAHLSPKQSIALVQMGGRFAFVGVTSEHITPLRVVEDAQEAATIRTELRLRKREKEAAEFGAILNDESQRTAERVEPAMTPTGETEQVARTREDLKGLLENLKAYRGSAAGEVRRSADHKAA